MDFLWTGPKTAKCPAMQETVHQMIILPFADSAL